MQAEDIKKNYENIKIDFGKKGTRYLKEYFPFCMNVKNDDEKVLLDTGGQMNRCDYFVAKIKDNVLYRKNEMTGEFFLYANLVEMERLGNDQATPDKSSK